VAIELSMAGAEIRISGTEAAARSASGWRISAFPKDSRELNL